MKQVWVNAATWSATASTTRGALLPTVVTAIPEPRSIRWLPSTSITIPPPARAANTGMVVPTPGGTAACLRRMSSRDRGPGISVTRRRSWATGVRSDMAGAPREVGVAPSLRTAAYAAQYFFVMVMMLGRHGGADGAAAPAVLHRHRRRRHRERCRRASARDPARALAAAAPARAAPGRRAVRPRGRAALPLPRRPGTAPARARPARAR